MEYLYDCITELNKPISERKTEKIIKYIESLSPFMTLIQDELIKNSEHLQNTVKIFHYIKKLKNEIIVKEGDKGNEFFIILRGKVAILVFQPEYYNMTEEEYILHLLKLKKNNENECIRQTIIHNQLIYPIEENFDSLFKGLIQRKTTGGVYLENENILKKADEVYCYLKMKNNKDIKKISPNDYIRINRIDNSIIEKSGLNYDEKGNKRNRVVIMSYHLVNYFETGQTFGEVALKNSSNKRIATVIAIEDCDIVYIVRKEYNLLIKNSIERNVKNFYSVIYSFNCFLYLILC
jgi:CRP-like cAMP-binding protein